MKVGVAGAGRIGSRHAAVLAAHPEVTEVVLFDPVGARAESVARTLGAAAVTSVDQLFAQDLDALAIATTTGAHAELIEASAAASVACFCEKPIALDSARTREVQQVVVEYGARVQIGFQRRFDVGYRAAREAVRSGELGELRRCHIISADPAPSSPEFIAASGGMFRDLSIHDLDIVRWVSGREVVEVYVAGANRGASSFTDAGDVDECAGVLVLDDHTLVTMQGSRYNGAGYDVRMEVSGTLGTHMVGLSDRTPLRSAEPGVTFPGGMPWTMFWERFEPSYAAQLYAFVDMTAGRCDSPCSVTDALQSLYAAEALELSRREHRPVRVAEVQPG